MFENIVGREPLKQFFVNQLERDTRVAILLHGPPATGKSMFLKEIADGKGVYVQATMASKEGLAFFLIRTKPNILCLDELDKLSQRDQTMLLGLIQDNQITMMYRKRQYIITNFNTWLISSANDINRIISPLQSRFVKIYMPPYTEDEFRQIVNKTCDKYGRTYNAYLYKMKLNRDPRLVVAIARTCQTTPEINAFMELISYGNNRSLS